MGAKAAAVKDFWVNRQANADEISRRMAIADRREAREKAAKKEAKKNR